jgi:hypothetical protein
MAFQGCEKLETISGLSGTITVNNSSFGDRKKLKQSNFDNVTFSVEENTGTSCFRNCLLLTSLAFDD